MRTFRPRLGKLVTVVTLFACVWFVARGTPLIIGLAFPEADRVLRQSSVPVGFHDPVESGPVLRDVSGLSAESMSPDGVSENVAVSAHQDGTSRVSNGLGDLPVCKQEIRLVGAVVVAGSEERSFAYLETRGATMLYRVGGSVDGLEVIGIRERRVFVRLPAGSLCQVTMMSQPSRGKARQESVVPHLTADGVSQDELERGIKDHGDRMTYTVSRGLFQKALSDWTSLSQSARAVPYKENGQVVGVTLLEVRDASLLAKLGLKSGDIVRAVDGLHISDAESAVADPESVLPELRMMGEMDSAMVLVIRDGDLVTMEYFIE